MIVELQETLPSHFYELQDFLADVTAEKSLEFVIAGGSISNHFIETFHGISAPSKDIDVFIDSLPEFVVAALERKLGGNVDKEVIDAGLDYEGEDLILPTIVRFPFQGYTVELIAMKLDRLYDFDFRFRMFYLHKGRLFAHQHALEDIRQKRLKVICPHSYRSTLVRKDRFEQTLGFTMDPVSEQFFHWYISRKQVKTSYVKDYVRKRSLSEETRNRLFAWVDTHSVEVEGEHLVKPGAATFPYHPSIEEVVFEASNTRKFAMGLYDGDLERFSPYPVPERTVHLKEKWLNESLLSPFKRLRFLVESYGRLRSMFVLDFDVDQLNEDNLFSHIDDLLANPTTNQLDLKVARQQSGRSLMREVKPRVPLPRVMTARSFYRLGSNYSYGDVVTNRVFSIRLDERECFNFRRTPTGEYTYVGCISDTTFPFVYARSVVKGLQEAYPFIVAGKDGDDLKCAFPFVGQDYYAGLFNAYHTLLFPDIPNRTFFSMRFRTLKTHDDYFDDHLAWCIEQNKTSEAL